MREMLNATEAGGRTDAERARLFSHWGGRAGSLEEAVIDAKGLAGQCFANGHDELAKMWREVAKWLASRAETERRKQQEFR
jgi:hypothetical protein